MQKHIRKLSDKKIFFKATFWVLFALVLITTLMPLDNIQPVISFNFIDKIIHFVYFLLLAVSLMLAYPRISVSYSILFLSIFGLLIEIFQHYLPTGRSFDWYDALFDSLGAIAGVLLTQKFARFFMNKV